MDLEIGALAFRVLPDSPRPLPGIQVGWGMEKSDMAIGLDARTYFQG